MHILKHLKHIESAIINIIEKEFIEYLEEEIVNYSCHIILIEPYSMILHIVLMQFHYLLFS